MAEIPPPGHGGGGDAPPQNPPGDEPQPPPLRIRRTHVSQEAITLFKTLPLYNKLEINKKIELENIGRMNKSIHHALDAVNYPTAGSDAASLITVVDEELADLLDDSIRERYKDILPISIVKWISDTQKAQGETQILSKRSSAELSSDTHAKLLEARIAKRRCMTGDDIVPRESGKAVELIFPQILFDTEISVAIPLPFFIYRNMRYIIDHLGSLPMVKCNPLDGTTKGFYIIDVEKLSLTLGKELSIDCSEWGQAAFQMLRFHQMRDVKGASGGFSEWYAMHFDFFFKLIDRDEFYSAWKALELELRQEFRSEKKAFCATHYANAYALVKAEKKILDRVQALQGQGKLASSDRPGYFPPRSGGSNGKFSRPGNTYTSSPSFPSSSTKNSLPPCCILCGQRGHTIFTHSNDTGPAFFGDGKPTWARFINRFLRATDNREICIKFNLRGERSACTHAKGARAHICSFCGKDSHFAFSWTCRTSPPDA
jgi:hypothetical protein